MDSRARRVLGGFVVCANLDVVRPVNSTWQRTGCQQVYCPGGEEQRPGARIRELIREVRIDQVASSLEQEANVKLCGGGSSVHAFLGLTKSTYFSNSDGVAGRRSVRQLRRKTFVQPDSPAHEANGSSASSGRRGPASTGSSSSTI